MSRVSAVVIGRLPTTAPTTDSVSCWQQFPLGVLLLITNSPFQDSLIALGIVFDRRMVTGSPKWTALVKRSPNRN